MADEKQGTSKRLAANARPVSREAVVDPGSASLRATPLIRAGVVALIAVPLLRQGVLAARGFGEWVKHDPVFTLYAPVVLPAALRIAARTHARLVTVRLSTNEWRAAYLALTVLLLCGVFVSYANGSRPPVEPYMLKTSAAALEADVAHRQALKQLRARVRAANSEDARNAAEHELMTDAAARSASYNETFRPFQGLRDAFERASLPAWLTGIVNTAAALLVAWLFWQFGLTAYARLNQRLPVPVLESLVNEYMLVVALMVLWFPFRLYTEWYSGLYSLENLAQFVAAIVLIVALVIAIYLLFVGQHGKTIPVLTAISTVGGMAFGAVSQFAPWVLWGCERALSNVPLTIWFVIAILFSLAIAVTTFHPSRSDTPAHP